MKVEGIQKIQHFCDVVIYGSPFLLHETLPIPTYRKQASQRHPTTPKTTDRFIKYVFTSSFDRRICSMYQLSAANVSLGGEGRRLREATERGRAPCVIHVSGFTGGRASVSPLLPPAWERRDQLIGRRSMHAPSVSEETAV